MLGRRLAVLGGAVTGAALVMSFIAPQAQALLVLPSLGACGFQGQQRRSGTGQPPASRCLSAHRV